MAKKRRRSCPRCRHSRRHLIRTRRVAVSIRDTDPGPGLGPRFGLAEQIGRRLRSGRLSSSLASSPANSSPTDPQSPRGGAEKSPPLRGSYHHRDRARGRFLDPVATTRPTPLQRGIASDPEMSRRRCRTRARRRSREVRQIRRARTWNSFRFRTCRGGLLGRACGLAWERSKCQRVVLL